MIVNVGVGVSFLIVLFIILAVFYSKPKINSIENQYFKKMIIITSFGLFIEVLIYCSVLFFSNMPNIFFELLIKILYIYYCLWMYYFVSYAFVIFFQITDRENQKYKNFKKLIKIFYTITFILSIVLPITLKINDVYIYPYGIGTTMQYIIVTIGMNLIGIFAAMNYKILKKKESYPFVACLILGIVSVVIQLLYHQFLFIVPSHAIAIILMYFTIENPDIRLINELNIAKDQADKANQAKSDFLSSMSHEIRTPLNAIVGFSEALSEEELTDSAKDEVNDIIMASNSLLEIVNGILDISKIESGKIEIVNNEYKFKEIFDNLVALTKARLGDKPLDFRFHYDESIPNYLYGDYTRVQQIILNILTNAVKYTKEGYVDFRVSSIIKGEICRLIISVEDSGIGIKQENIDKLFSKFERLDLDKNITIEGTGLGLAITKKLVELMKGSIVVQSIYGKGSKFTISIDQRIVYKQEEVIPKEELKNNSIKPLDISGKQILIVDDNKINLKVAARLLQTYHVVTEEADSGFACLEKIKEKQYDLILMDDMMPKMSGVETLKQLKQIPNFNTKVIALTANAIAGMKEKYLKDGFDDYLSKPIDKAELQKILEKYLNS